VLSLALDAGASTVAIDKPTLHRYRRRLAKGFEGFLHLRVVNVGIDHSGGQVGVSEHLLNQADLTCFPVEVGCERVPECVGRDCYHVERSPGVVPLWSFR